MSDVVYLAVLHRDGTSYVLDLYDHEIAQHVREERQHRCLFVNAYPSRAQAEEALRRADRQRSVFGLRRRPATCCS